MKNKVKGLLCKKYGKTTKGLQNKSSDDCSIDWRNVGPVYCYDAQTRKVMEANDSFLVMLKYSAEDLATLYVEHIVVDDFKNIEENIKKRLQADNVQPVLRQYRCKDGEMLFVETTAQVVTVGEKQYIVVSMWDVTKWQHLQNRFLLATQVFDNAIDGIVVTDVEGVIQFANPAFLQNTGYSLEEVMGMTPRILKSGRQDEHFYQEMWKCLNEVGQWKGEIWNRRKNGEIYREWLVSNAIKDDLGQVFLYAGMFRDLSERMKYEEQIKYQAYHDLLTELPNRRFFYEKMHEYLAMAKRYDHILSVMFIDLDGFKNVNDNFGHNIGDLLLKEVGERLKKSVRETDIVARMGGDEFTLILPEIRENTDAKVVAEKINKTLNQPFELQGNQISISSSIGISIFPDHGDEAELLVKKADDAMYKAKLAGKNMYQFYSE